MDRGWYVRLGFIVVVAVASWFALWPSLHEFLPAPEWVRNTMQSGIALGLDIRGGLRLQYEVEVDEAIVDRRNSRADQMLDRICERLEICSEGEQPTTEQRDALARRVEAGAISDESFRLDFSDAADLSVVDGDLLSYWGDLREVGRTDTTISLALTDAAVSRLRETAVDLAVQTIAERVDELGVREAAVVPHNQDIVIELPGADEAEFERARRNIARTARLEFKVVDDLATFVRDLDDLPEGIERRSESVSAGEEHRSVVTSYLYASGPEAEAMLSEYIERLSLERRIPSDHQLALGKADPDEDAAADAPPPWRTYYLYDRSELGGDAIDDAAVAFDQRTNQPYVSINFTGPGGLQFKSLTGANIKRRMAIVLDDKVTSAPVIQSEIGGGRAQITLNSYRSYNDVLNEAKDLVIVLRAGALPAPIRPANEQMIGPTLGRDAVSQGALGAVLGVLLVLIFMAVYYQVGGLVADVMVLLNLLFLLALLSLFNATITLPGIAGVALTIGMAVDANVLINERIREELKLGKSARTAVELGYQRAFWSIFDSQFTTFIAGVVLFEYGTGPIRGFAVTLMAGILTSLFSGVFCSKVMFDWIVSGLKVQRLRVG